MLRLRGHERSAALFVLGGVIAAGCGSGSTRLQCGAPPAGAPVYIGSLHSGLVVEVRKHGVAERELVVQGTFHWWANQRWLAVPSAAGGVGLHNVHSAMCLDVPESAGNGANAIQRPCDGGARQSWRIEGAEDGCRIVNVESGKCLEVLKYSMEREGAVGVWECHKGANQKWELHVGGFETTLRPESG